MFKTWGESMKKSNVLRVEVKTIEQEYIQQKDLPKMFGMCLNTIKKYIKDYKETHVAGVDYIDLEYNLKLLKVSSFRNYMQSIHGKWAKN